MKRPRAAWVCFGAILACCGLAVAQTPSNPKTEDKSDAKPSIYGKEVSHLEPFLKERGYTSIPLERSRAGSITIVVSVGEKRLRLVCDTGATVSMLDEKRTKELKIDWQKSDYDVPAGEVDFAKCCKIEVMKLGAFRAHGIRFFSFDTTNGNKRLEQSKDTPVDGLLGWDVLKDYSAIIDVRGLRLFLRTQP